MSIRVTLSANAGVAIEIGGIRIWVDALHDVQVPGFSTLRAQRLRQLWTAEAFQSPDVIVYTHCHPDHYSQQLTTEAHLRWPKARLILPQKEFAEQELVSGDEYTAVVEGAVLHFYRLPHESQHYTADVSHYGLTITHGTEAILLPGDCAVVSPALLPLIARQHFRLVLLNFPWITLRKGREFIEQHILADHIIVDHLPFAEDDTEHFRAAAVSEAERLHTYSGRFPASGHDSVRRVELRRGSLLHWICMK